MATIERKENEEVVRILSAKIKRLKDALCKKLEKKIYDSLILKLKVSFQIKLKAKKIENLQKIEGLKLKEINYTEDLTYFKQIDGVVEPLIQKRNVFKEKLVHDSFSCDICLKAFSNKIGLEKHLRIHTGKKCIVLSECNLCLKAFTNNIDLKKHLRTHTCESCTKLFLCNQCSKTFPCYGERKTNLYAVQCSKTIPSYKKRKIFQIF